MNDNEKKVQPERTSPHQKPELSFEELMKLLWDSRAGDGEQVFHEMLDDLFVLSAVVDIQRETILLLAHGYIPRKEALRQAALGTGVADRVLGKWEKYSQPEA